MPYTRRQFAHLLQASTALTVVGFSQQSLAAGSAVAVGSGLSETAGKRALLSRARFSPLVGTDFRLQGGALNLLAVEEVRYGAGLSARKSNAPRAECTLLRFSGQGLELAEGTHKLTHETLGEIHLHLSPGQSGRYVARLASLPSAYLENAAIPRRQPTPKNTAA
jgi:hypothetical protein